MIKKYFGLAIVFAICVYSAMFIDVALTVGMAAAFTVLYQALTLSVVEVSVSFDNAVVNATHLHRMNALWRKIFLTVGIAVAVIGMRFYLPLQIVSVVGNLSLAEAYGLAVNDGAAFGKVLSDASATVAGFGGSFLLMTALAFFVQAEKEHHWIPLIEKPLEAWAELMESSGIGPARIGECVVTLGAAYGISSIQGNTDFLFAAIAGVATFYAVDILKRVVEKLDERLQTSKAKWIAGGFGTFIYLEVLDASFSFDGVIAAFALSDNLWVIAGALGVGAIFVRSMTVMLDETGTLKQYKFLENGAFVAITILAATMYIGELIHIPHWIVAVTSVLSIAGAVMHSVYDDKRLAKEEQVTSP